MSRPVRGVLLDAKKNTIEAVDLDGSLDTFYKVLNCDCIDVATRMIGEHYYDVYIDDEGLLKGDVVVSALESRRGGHIMLVGNLFICKHDDEGEHISLTEEEVREILDEVMWVVSPDLRFSPVIWMDY